MDTQDKEQNQEQENQFEDVMIYEMGAIMGTYASSGGLLVSVL